MTNRSRQHRSGRDFAEWLLREISNRLMTVSQFCQAAEMDDSTIRSWKRKPDLRLRGLTVVRIARALGVTREVIERQLDC